MSKLTLSIFSLSLGILLSSIHAGTYAADTSGSDTSGASAPSATGASAPDATTTVEVPFVVLVPVQVHADPNLAGGCWVRIFDGANFKGNDELTIAGPIDMKTMKTPSGINWKRKAESLIVGPKATVQVFENEFFRDKNVSFKPGQQVPSLSKELGFLHSIDSLKVTCNK